MLCSAFGRSIALLRAGKNKGRLLVEGDLIFVMRRALVMATLFDFMVALVSA